MKKLLFILFAIISMAASNVNAQSISGVPISGDFNIAVQNFKNKGFILKKTIEEGAILKGKMGINQVELFIFKTPITKKFYKAVVYMEEESGWYSLKRTYNKFVDLFVEKYGTYTGYLETFQDPYYEGDGYEVSALTQEKLDWFTYWQNQPNLYLMVQISKYKQVKIVYENNKLTDLATDEYKKLNSRIF